jgi:Skp family chaperone for outer membrane proteins
MKIQALVATLALAGASAFAAQPATDTTNHSQTTASADAPKGEGLMDKTKRVLHKMGDKMRATGHKIASKVDNKTDKADHRDNKTEHAARSSDTRSMGAPGADTPDSARRSRMDEAYANSKKARPQQP